MCRSSRWLRAWRWLLAAGLLLSLARSRPAQAQSAGPTYIVQPGDSLYAIAWQFGLPLADLQAANPGLDPAALAVGQALTIPGYAGVGGVLGAHPLEPGETLDSLAVRLGLTRASLIRLNRLVNPERLYLGQSIVVVDQLDAAPAMPEGQAYALEGGSFLAWAAARNQNPWALAALNHLPHPGRVPAGRLVFAPGGGRPPRGLAYPLLELSVAHGPARQGGTLALALTTAAPAAVSGTFAGQPLAWVAAPPGAQAVLGVPRLWEPDVYEMAVSAEIGGRVLRFTQWAPVRPGDYGADPPLTVDPETIDPAVTGPELQQVRQLVAPVTLERLWDGVWALPSVGSLRSRYGSLRSYNGGPWDSFHTGVDFSGAEDRPITAPAPGVVVFAGPLVVRGNATILDHGWGVYSGYWHQSSILVQVGQRVETGHILGYQGATGRVTGPHLHWEIWVGGVQVEPLEWTQTAFP